ncbi:MAG: hypothetical protein M0D57_04990 [Sphingobacteriales bacterium JAD_PAG50586_3]|nr:MAG: hypothetical protein M0D57_04990 [Sphingobacteriales bacterium JAD_PAG50586_3]
MSPLFLVSMNDPTPKPIPFIRELCKHKTEDEILDAEFRFREYVKFVKELCEELEGEPLPTIDF